MTKAIFCPLKNKYFQLFSEGKKTVELRSINSPVAKQALKHGAGSLIEMREGYRGNKLLYKVEKIEIYDKVGDIADEVLEKACVTRDEALSVIGEGALVAIHVRARK